MNREQLQRISPAKLKLILELMEESKGKGTDAIMPLLMHANQQMQQQGLSFTPEETNLILQLLKEDMSPEEVKKLSMMQAILSSWNR